MPSPAIALSGAHLQLFTSMISLEEAAVLFEQLPDSVHDYMTRRGSNYGISAEDLLRKTPSDLHGHPELIEQFWRDRHISHFHATSKGGCPGCFDNWMAEDSSPNQSRGNDYMEGHERQEAYQGNASLADNLLKEAGRGAAVSAGGIAMHAAAPWLMTAATAAIPVVGTVVGAVAGVYGVAKIGQWLNDDDNQDRPCGWATPAAGDSYLALLEGELCDDHFLLIKDGKRYVMTTERARSMIQDETVAMHHKQWIVARLHGQNPPFPMEPTKPAPTPGRTITIADPWSDLADDIKTAIDDDERLMMGPH